MSPLQAHEHTFETIVGQDLVKRFLAAACDQGRLPQSLLFAGPEGVGKRSLMFALAKRLVAADYADQPDAVERAHGKVTRGTHPDVLVLMPKSASGQIVKKQLEELEDSAHYAPLESSRRVILIAPVEAMNDIAANHLLKILEEPPPRVHFLLASEYIHRTLDTIRSRCALVRCPPLEPAVLAEWLCGERRCSHEKALAAARLADGAPGRALELLEGDAMKRRSRMEHELSFFYDEGYSSVFRVANNLLDIAEGPPGAIAMLTVWFRDLLVASLDREREGSVDSTVLINTDMTKAVEKTVARFGPQGLAHALDAVLERSDAANRTFINGNLLMESLLTELGVALKQ